MPVRFTKENTKRVQQNGAAKRRKGSVQEAIGWWREHVGTRPFTLHELRAWLRSKRRIFIDGTEQKALMRMHKSGECPLDLTDAKRHIYRFKG